MKKLIGRTDIEDALKRLDKLTQEEARMATAQVLKVVHSVDDRVREVADNVDQVKRLSYHIIVNSGRGASCVLTASLQETNCGTAFTNGSLHQTRPRTTTLRVAPIRRERRTGSSEVGCSPGGNQRTP